MQASEVFLPIWLGERDKITVALLPAEGQPTDSVSLTAEKASFQVRCEGAESISLTQDFELLATSEGDSAEFDIRPANLGLGPIRFFATATMADGTVLRSEPLWIEVAP